MSTMNLTFADGIHHLILTDGDAGNALRTSVFDEYLSAIEEVKSFKGNTALLVTSDHEKTFSTGIDLEWLMQQDADGMKGFADAVARCLLELATLDVPTVCAINGNAYAAGAIIPCTFDFRLMREDRGRFCFPEVNINVPFEEVSMACARLVPAPQAIEEMIYTGVAFTGVECLEKGIVSSIHSLESLGESAKLLAMEMAKKDRTTFSQIKKVYRKDIYALKERRLG